MRRIAVDAMGGDDAPTAEVEGSWRAVRDHGAEVILVGDRDRIEQELARLGARDPRLHVHHASQVITMSDHPGAAVKTKKDSSMRVCFDLARRGEAQAVVSAGNSGAMLACGLFVMKRLRGVDRPGIVALSPQPGGGHCVVLDVGVNTEVKPTTMAQYAVMGTTYARLLLGIARPRVAVLANGEEETKGTQLTREALRLLGNEGIPKDFDFIGYAEGRDFFNGLADVIVTDGFTGNVALKTTEGATRFIGDFLKGEVARSWRVGLGALLMKPAFAALRRRLEPDELGGGPLLGVDGVVIICHGRSSPLAIMNGILAAQRFVGSGLAPAIADAIERHRAIWQEDPASIDPANTDPTTEKVQNSSSIGRGKQNNPPTPRTPTAEG